VIRFIFLALATIGACQNCSSAPVPQCIAPRSVDEVCVMPSIATCLNTDAGLGACERAADTKCGLVAGASAQVWTSLEQAEQIQGFVPRR
jgi:hypothetical protein